jgi:hypothetical protein
MADDPIDRMLEREDTGTSRTKGTLSEARQATSEMARPASEPNVREGSSLMGILRSLRTGGRKPSRDSRD